MTVCSGKLWQAGAANQGLLGFVALGCTLKEAAPGSTVQPGCLC